MLLKRRAGAAVACVFMTDGSTSHRAFIAEEELRALRRSEAQEATASLGLAPEDVHFLDLPDGRLRGSLAGAVSLAGNLIDRYRPDEVYVPLREDGIADHEATYSAVVRACGASDLQCEICEYPVWAWNQWPWVSLRLDLSRDTLQRLVQVARMGLGRRLVRACTMGMDVRGVQKEKRQILATYRSQMTALQAGAGWPTLQDVSEGEFLACFFQDYEVFRCSRVAQSAS